jgi:predicted PolB exonuclease-like 3'-5' exonuclease
MNKLVFDIETIGEDFDKLDSTTQDVLTRFIKKTSKTEEEYELALKEVKNSLGLSPLTGEIVAIGLLDTEQDKGAVYYQNENEDEKLEENGIKYTVYSEKEMLKKFWSLTENCNQVISFNGRGFDIPFLIARSAVYNIRPSVDLMPYRYAKHYETKHLDLLDHLSYFGSTRKQNLHLWCRALGITSPKANGVDGSEVGKLFKEKKFLSIAKYNAEDLFATKKLYKKWQKYMAF